MHVWTKQSGATLIEVLVALMIVSVGLLGAIKLQLVSSQHARVSSQSLAVTTLGTEAVERIGSARQGNGYWALAYGTATANAPALLQDWLGRIKALPSGDAQIECSGTTCTVTIRWKVRPADNAYVTAAYVTRH